MKATYVGRAVNFAVVPLAKLLHFTVLTGVSGLCNSSVFILSSFLYLGANNREFHRFFLDGYMYLLAPTADFLRE